MVTVAELIVAMARSGRRVSKRTLRNWWYEQILPPPDRRWRGRKGSVSYWHDDRVFGQAAIVHELLSHKVTFETAGAYLWILGFDIPLEKAKAGIEGWVVTFRERLGNQAPGESMEDQVWRTAERFARKDAKIRGGSRADAEGRALYSLTGELLELLAGVRDGEPDGDNQLWAEDTANELFEHLDFLHALRPPPEGWLQGPETPMPSIETVEQVVKLISTFVALPRQEKAFRAATPCDLGRARRITMLAANRLDEAVAVTTTDYGEQRPLFARVIGGWMWLLFPSLLVAMKSPAPRQQIVQWLFGLSGKIRKQRVQGAMRAAEARRRPARVDRRAPAPVSVSCCSRYCRPCGEE